MTQEKLAERADIDVSYSSLLERGERAPNLCVLIKIGIALDVDPALMVSMKLARLRGDV